MSMQVRFYTEKDSLEDFLPREVLNHPAFSIDQFNEMVEEELNYEYLRLAVNAIASRFGCRLEVS